MLGGPMGAGQAGVSTWAATRRSLMRRPLPSIRHSGSWTFDKKPAGNMRFFRTLSQRSSASHQAT